MPFPPPQDQTHIFHRAGRFFTTEPPGKPTLQAPQSALVRFFPLIGNFMDSKMPLFTSFNISEVHLKNDPIS